MFLGQVIYRAQVFDVCITDRKRDAIAKSVRFIRAERPAGKWDATIVIKDMSVSPGRAVLRVTRDWPELLEWMYRLPKGSIRGELAVGRETY